MCVHRMDVMSFSSLSIVVWSRRHACSQQLVKAREEERERAIREGKMDDPTKPKRLDEAITMVGTCQDMCPEFERYRRERQNNLDRWEMVRVV